MLWGTFEDFAEVGRIPWSAAGGPTASLSELRRKLPNYSGLLTSGDPKGDADWLTNLRSIGGSPQRKFRPQGVPLFPGDCS